MSKKQLADVLIKILGLSLCAHSVTSVFIAIIGALRIGEVGFQSMPRTSPAYLTTLILALIPFAIGVCFILKSRQVTDKLFQDQAE